MVGLPGIVHHQQAGFVVQQGTQVRRRALDDGGTKVIVAEGLDPASEEREDVRLLAQRDPQNPIGEAGLHVGGVGQRGDQRRLADAAQPMDGADNKGTGRRVGRHVVHQRLAHLWTRDKVAWHRRCLEGDANGRT